MLILSDNATICGASPFFYYRTGEISHSFWPFDSHLELVIFKKKDTQQEFPNIAEKKQASGLLLRLEDLDNCV